jgi:hypothetical protein
VKLVDAGSEPRSVLLIRGAPNAVQNLTLAADYVLTKDGQAQDDHAIAMRVPGQGSRLAHDEAIGATHRAYHGSGGAYASGFMIVLDDLDLAEPGRACTVRGPVDPSGAPGDVNFACEHANDARIMSLARLATTWLSPWPVLPSEPIGIGARWQTVTHRAVSGDLVVIVTTNYVLLKRDSGQAHIQGVVAVTGPDQETHGSRISVEGGRGSIDSVITLGSLFAKTKSHFETKMHLVRDDGSESELACSIDHELTPEEPAVDFAAAESLARRFDVSGGSHSDIDVMLSESPASVQLYCDEGRYRACEVLGIRYMNGESVKADAGHANGLFEIACDHGQAYSCTILGTNVLQAKGTAFDSDRGIFLLTKACTLGDVEGCHIITMIYRDAAEQSLAVGNSRIAMQILASACEQRDANGCAGLALVFASGLGVERDDAKARAFNQRACILKDERACARLSP